MYVYENKKMQRSLLCSIVISYNINNFINKFTENNRQMFELARGKRKH